jgi:hypothetical protein
MSLIKLNKNTQYLIINIKFENSLPIYKIRAKIFNILDLHYRTYIYDWNLIQILNNKDNILTYYIYTNTANLILIKKIYKYIHIINRNHKNLLITLGCYDYKYFKNEIEKNKKYLCIYYKKLDKWTFICIHEHNICKNDCKNYFL